MPAVPTGMVISASALSSTTLEPSRMAVNAGAASPVTSVSPPAPLKPAAGV